MKSISITSCVIVALLITGCAGIGNRSAPAGLTGNINATPSPADLQSQLQAEFDRQGIDPAKVPQAAPHGAGNAVFDLQGVFKAGTPPSITLSWTERMLGDYNQDGLVGVSDLTPIGQHYNELVDHDDPAAHGGLAHWPTGDPDGAGAANWRSARIDGNDDGLIYLTDITTIAQHWNERLDGYRVYCKVPGAAEFTMLPNSDDTEAPFTIPRSAAAPAAANSPYRYMVDYEMSAGEGIYQFYLAPYDLSTSDIGALSPTLTLPDGEAPIADLFANISAGNPPLDLVLDASGSTDPDGTIVSYAWDFDGDGAYDEFTEVPAAEHTYTDGGIFAATVRVQDNQLQQDTASVDITVNQAPVAAIAITPPDPTVVPFSATFSASDSTDPDGTIVQYDWDWNGDGTYESIDVGPEPDIIRFVALPGEETVNVRVFDDQGLSDTASQAVVGLYGEWQVQSVVTDGGSDCSLALVDGFPAISYYDDGDWNLGYVRATDEFGVEEWGTPVEVTDDFGDEGRYGSLAVINGHPAIAFDNLQDDNTCYIRADDSQGSTWPANFRVINGERPWSLTLIEAAGRPAVAYQINSSIVYQRADDAVGTSWISSEKYVESTPDICNEPSMAIVNGNPAIAYKRLIDGHWYLEYVAASDSAGTGLWSLPVSVDGGVSFDAGINPYLTQLGTVPAITYGVGEDSPPDLEPCYIRSSSSQGSDGSWADPGPQLLTGTMSLSGTYTSVAGIGFYPQAVFKDDDSGTLWHVWARAFGGGDWMEPVLIDDGGGNSVGSFCVLKNINGRPAVAYYDTTAHALKYAVLR